MAKYSQNMAKYSQNTQINSNNKLNYSKIFATGDLQ